MGRVKDHLWDENAQIHSLDPYPQTQTQTQTGTDMKLNEFVPSTGKYLKKEDAMPDVLVTIKAFTTENVAQEGGPPEMKGCVYFNELEKPMVMNQTNSQLLAIASGLPNDAETDLFIGKKIVLYNDPTVSFGGKLTGGIRIRAPRNQAAPVAAQPAQRTPGADDDMNDDIPF